MRAFKQFYIEFRADSKVKLSELAAVVANHLSNAPLKSIEYRTKGSIASEFRIVNEEDIEAKIGEGHDLSYNPIIWLHLSAPENSDIDLKQLAYEIINHPKFLEVNKEKGGEDNEDEGS